MATKGKSAITWVLLGFVLLGLGGFGITNFAGSTSPALAEVGGVEVTADDYARGLRSELEALQAQAQGVQITMAQASAMGLPQQVQARLIAAAALEAQARTLGLSAGDETVARQIMAAPGFAGPAGQFDRARYADVLRREGLSEAQFEDDVRMDEARQVLQRAVAGGVGAPEAQVARVAGWLTETRDLLWRELTAADLATPVPAPDDAALEAWHAAHPDLYTAPETREITAVWLTPEAVAETVQLDEAALRAVYEQRRAEFVKPARRMVERLVYPDTAAAAEARARFDAGAATFEQLAAERGLALADIDLGEVTQGELGAAGETVFAATQNGVVGPVETEVGPALIAVNAILDPVEVPFEAAREELRAEAALDRAARQVEERQADLADRLAGGATLEDLAAEGGMQIAQIAWTGDEATGGPLAGYEAFRAKASALTAQDFPTLEPLADGGLFALRLDKLVPPALRPLAEVRDAVAADWQADQTRQALRAQADALVAAGTVTGGTAALGLTRDAQIEAAPDGIVAAAFDLAPGAAAVVEAEGRVAVVALDAVHPADPASPEVAGLLDAVRKGTAESLAGDLFADYARALQARHGLKLHPEVAAAVNTRFP